MYFLRVVRDKSELEGTVFIEVLPGRYRGKCWNDGSIFFDEETFGFFEPFIEREVPEYDHYAFTEVSRPRWIRVASSLRAFATELLVAAAAQSMPKGLRFVFSGTEVSFSQNLPGNTRALADAATGFAEWLERVLEEHDAVSILGI